MAAGLNYLYGTDTFTKDNYSETDFAISNVGENGAEMCIRDSRNR